MPATIPERCSSFMSGMNGLPAIAALRVLASKKVTPLYRRQWKSVKPHNSKFRVHGLWKQIEMRSPLEYDSSDRRVVKRWRAIRQQSSLHKKY